MPVGRKADTEGAALGNGDEPAFNTRWCQRGKVPPPAGGSTQKPLNPLDCLLEEIATTARRLRMDSRVHSQGSLTP